MEEINMITRLNQSLVSLSKRWWVVVLVLTLNAASFGILFSLEDQFERLSGLPTFDTQNALTADQIIEQLPLYQGEARDAYLRFAAFDFVFPFAAALNLAVLWALFLRTNTWHIAGRLLAWNIPVLAFLGTLFDWGENFGFLTILSSGAAPEAGILQTALMFKALKLIMLNVSFGLTSALLVFALANWTTRVIQAQRHIRHERARA
jgi:hypothetical protein